MRSVSLLFVLAFASSTDAVAQELPLQPGQRVRVTAPALDLNEYEDTLRPLCGDTLVLESLSCPLSDVMWLHSAHPIAS